MKNRFFLLILLMPLVWTGCDNEPHFPEASYYDGVYISQEGVGTGSGKVSYIDRDIGGVENDIYQLANGTAIGGAVQSLCFVPGYIYVICSNQVEIVDVYEFKHQNTISNFLEAREMSQKDTLAFITEWRSVTDSGWVRVINVSDNTVLDTLVVGKGPTKMLQVSNRLFVANSKDSSVSVIDMATVTVETHLTVGDFPQNMVIDNNGVVWVLCKGKDAASGGPTPGLLATFNPTTLTVGSSIPFPAGSNPDFLIAKDAYQQYFYYYYNGGVYYFNSANTSLPSSPLIHTVGVTNGLGIDPQTGFLYVADKVTGTGNGRLRWYNGTTGLWVDSSDVGPNPNNFLFVNP